MSRRGRPVKSNDKGSNLTLQGLMNKEWKVCHTSFLLSPTRAEDEPLVKRASLIISNALPKLRTFSVSFTRCNAIQFSDRTPPALLIEVFVADTVIFHGYFINWSLWTKDDGEGRLPLPIYLYTGKADVAAVVNQTLMKTFDFVMTPVDLNATQLIKLLALFVRHADEKEDKCAVLRYTIPGMAKGNNISVTNDVKSLLVVLKFLIEEAPKEEDVSSSFYEKLLKHYRMAYQLNLGHAVLRHVALPEAMATENGVIRMDNEEVLTASLALLDSFFSIPQDANSTPSISSIASSCP